MPAPVPEIHPRREWPRVAAFAALTVVGVCVCVLLVAPFLAGVTWGLALTVVALPTHRWIQRRVVNGNLAAGLSTTLVVLVIGLPMAWVAVQLTTEARRAAATVEAQTAEKAETAGQQAAEKAKNNAKSEQEAAQDAENAKIESRQNGWRDYVAQFPYVGSYLAQLNAAEVEARTREWLDRLLGSSFGVVKGAADAILQTLVAVFILFFALRDHRSLLNQARGYLPVSADAADRIFCQASDAIHSTIYGTFVTSALQGVTGGLLFWALGLPAPVLWGVVMTILGILPFVGAFLVWVPAAVYLVSEGQWWQAGMLVVWGLLMAGPVSNYLYAITVGRRMRMHAVPVLLAFIGGLAVFGVSGMILGPCVLAVTLALLDMWRHRAPDGSPIAAVQSAPPSDVPLILPSRT